MDKIMLKLGYFPRRRMAGAMLIVNEKKFEFIKLRSDKSIPLYELQRTGMDLQTYIKMIEHDVSVELGKEVFKYAESNIRDIQEDAFYSISYEIWLAIPKK